LMIVGFENDYADPHVRTMISDYHVSGVNLLRRNVKDSSQVKKMISDLQGLSSTTLFIATDQEGGSYIRFKFLSQLKPQSEITTPQEAESVARGRATELLDLGVNMNFSPVLDNVSDPKSYLYVRTFATTSESTGILGASMMKGYEKGNVIPVAKHFPGYGNILPDPHTNEAVLSIDRKELEQNLIPFKKVIDGGAKAIMTAHIRIPSVDDKPATLSVVFLKEILRDRIGFKGVIITDDLEMASAGGENIGRIAVDSIKAGADMVISTFTPSKQIEVFNALKQSVQKGEISEERINESVERILRLKEGLEI